MRSDKMSNLATNLLSPCSYFLFLNMSILSPKEKKGKICISSILCKLSSSVNLKTLYSRLSRECSWDTIWILGLNKEHSRGSKQRN